MSAKNDMAGFWSVIFTSLTILWGVFCALLLLTGPTMAQMAMAAVGLVALLVATLLCWANDA